MSTLLHIQVSPMGDNSISLSVAEEFLKRCEYCRSPAETSSSAISQQTPYPCWMAKRSSRITLLRVRPTRIDGGEARAPPESDRRDHRG